MGSVASVTRLPVGFMPEGDISVTQIEVKLPPGTPVEQTQQRLRTLTTSLKNRPEIKSVYTIAGVADDADGIAQHKGEIILTLVDPGDRELSQKEFEHAIAPLLSELPDTRYNFSNSNGGKAFSLVFTGTDPAELESAMQNLRNGIARLPGFSNMQVIKPLLRKELIVTPRPDGPWQPV